MIEVGTRTLKLECGLGGESQSAVKETNGRVHKGGG